MVITTIMYSKKELKNHKDRQLKRLSLYAARELSNISKNKIDIAVMCRQAIINLRIKMELNQI